jgi:hypothetical protein
MILITYLDLNTNKFRVMKGRLPAIDKNLSIEVDRQRYPRTHNRSYVVSKVKTKKRLDSVESTQRSPIDLINTFDNSSSLSVSRRRIKNYPKALNMLFDKKSERNQVSPDPSKSNSIAKFKGKGIIFSFVIKMQILDILKVS